MTDATRESGSDETRGQVVVRYWAAARAAAGVERDTLEVSGPVALDSVLEQLRTLHGDQPRFTAVLGVCSVLVDDRPVGKRGHGEVVVHPGETVELLPPFAGGSGESTPGTAAPRRQT